MVTRPVLTNFPQGFSTDLGLRNVPTLLTTSGRNIWVDSNGPGSTTSGGATLGKRGTFQRPLATVALALTVAQNYDTIWVKSGHTESIIAAGGWTFPSTLLGCRVIGMGNGDSRPQISFTTVAGASCLIQGAGTEIINIIGLPGSGSHSYTQPFDVRAAGVYLCIEWRDVTATTTEAVRAILTSAAAKNCRFDLRYVGLGAGAVCLNAIRLVGSFNMVINIDFYGNATTAVVEFATTACKNILVVGTSNNAASSGGTTKIVTDTITGSTFQTEVYNAATNPGTLFQGSAVAA